jgi:hypothetical protein
VVGASSEVTGKPARGEDTGRHQSVFACRVRELQRVDCRPLEGRPQRDQGWFVRHGASLRSST